MFSCHVLFSLFFLLCVCACVSQGRVLLHCRRCKFTKFVYILENKGYLKKKKNLIKGDSSLSVVERVASFSCVGSERARRHWEFPARSVNSRLDSRFNTDSSSRQGDLGTHFFPTAAWFLAEHQVNGVAYCLEPLRLNLLGRYFHQLVTDANRRWKLCREQGNGTA